MENASKALIVAGGILLALIVLTLLVYGLTATGRIEEAQNKADETEELAKFNMEYESYNKKRMYGIELISLINKAMEHNSKMNASKIDHPYYINIKFTTIEPFKNQLFRIDNTQESKEEKEVKNVNTYKTDLQALGIYDQAKSKLSLAKGTYTLGTFQNNGESFVINNDFTIKFSASTEDIIRTTVGGSTTYKIYSSLTNFKKAVFECQKVSYNKNTGRIYEIVFKQVKVN